MASSAPQLGRYEDLHTSKPARTFNLTGYVNRIFPLVAKQQFLQVNPLVYTDIHSVRQTTIKIYRYSNLPTLSLHNNH